MYEREVHLFYLKEWIAVEVVDVSSIGFRARHLAQLLLLLLLFGLKNKHVFGMLSIYFELKLAL